MPRVERFKSEVGAFFRHCPQCGKRFEVRPEGESLLSQEDKVVGSFSSMAAQLSLFPSLQKHYYKPGMTVGEQDLLLSYRCSSCGHQWSELRQYFSSFGKPGSTPP